MTSPLGRAGRSIAVAALAGLALLPTGAMAADATSASLTWSQVNQFNTVGTATNTNRTYLGFVVNAVTQQGPPSAGDATVSAGATLSGPAGWANPAAPKTVITGADPNGINAVYNVRFPGSSTGLGTYDPATGKGELEFTGKFEYRLHPGLAPAMVPVGGLPVSVTNPKIVLDGTAGKLFASGDGNPTGTAGAPYNRTTAVFTLDLSSATITEHVDGSQTITGIVPTSAQTGVFGTTAAYGPGVGGPNRDPNIFGTFSVRIKVPAVEAIAATPIVGPAGPAGPAGPKGDAGVAGASAGIRSYVLATAPFGSRTVNVAVLGKAGKPVTVGTVKGKTLKVRTLAKGTYKLVRTNRFAKSRSASIKVG